MEEPMILGKMFWGELSIADDLRIKGEQAKAVYQAYSEAFDALFNKLEAIDPKLASELDDLFSVFHDYNGYVLESAFVSGFRVSMELMQESLLRKRQEILCRRDFLEQSSVL